MLNKINYASSLQKTNEKEDAPLGMPLEFIEPSFQTQLNSIKTIWTHYNTSTKLQDCLFDFFSTSENPYFAVLKAIRHCGDFYSGKHDSLTLYIMKSFSTWIKKRKFRNHEMLNKCVKMCAFNLVSQQKNKSLISLVIEIYNLVDSKLIFLKSIHEMASQNNFKEACQYAILLNLFDEFDIKEFIIPLVIQNKFDVGEKFIKSRRRHLVDLVTYLDNLLCQKTFEKCLQDSLRNMNINGVDTSKFHWRACYRLIQKLVKADNSLMFACPNLISAHKNMTLMFLINKRFVKKNIGLESWEELILDMVGSDMNLQILVLFKVFQYGCLEEALMWAKRFHIPEFKWPNGLKELKSCIREASFEKLVAMERKNRALTFHKLCIPENKIRIIDTQSSFDKFLSNVVPQIKLMGLDCEWKPVFGFETKHVSLLQVATYTHVYILDIKTLREKKIPDDAWTNLKNNLLSNRDIIKLGFDIGGDFTHLKETFSEIRQFDIEENDYLDLKYLWKDLVGKHKFRFPFPSSSESSNNLSTLVEMCLGKKLDKSDQFSNWEKRPLRQSQIIYAALDAYCLIEVYDIICQECKRQNISLTAIDKYHLGKTINENSLTENVKCVSGPTSSLLKYKIVCGSMLVELGKELRRRGVNTIILGKDPPKKTFNDQEGPTILFTQARNVKNYKRYSKIFWIVSKDVKQQFLEVLTCLKVKPAEIENCASTRCEDCNSTSFIAFTKSELKELSNLPVGEAFDSSSSEKFKNLEFLIQNADGYVLTCLEYLNFKYSCSNPCLDPLQLGKRVILFSIIRHLITISSGNEKIDLFYVCKNCLSCSWDGKNNKNGLTGFRSEL